MLIEQYIHCLQTILYQILKILKQNERNDLTKFSNLQHINDRAISGTWITKCDVYINFSALGIIITITTEVFTFEDTHIRCEQSIAKELRNCWENKRKMEQILAIQSETQFQVKLKEIRQPRERIIPLYHLFNQQE